MLAACAFAACGSDEVEPTPTPDPKPELVKMSFLVNAGEETRTVLMHDGDNENQVWFHDGDEICIFDNDVEPPTEPHKFKTSLSADAPSATFTGEAHHTAAGFFYALYPYQSTASFNNSSSFYADIPKTQTPVLDSFDPKANVSVARIPMPDTQSSDFVITKLYNACALVKFTSTIDLKSVKLECKDGWLSGAMNIEIHPDDQAPTNLSNLTFSYPSSDSSEKYTFQDVELKNPDGIVFVPGTYYIAVWPGKYTNLKIILTNSSGQTKTGTLNSVTFERAKILNLGNF